MIARILLFLAFAWLGLQLVDAIWGS